MREGTLIAPIPKEYLTYSEQKKIEETEKYYQKIEGLYQRMDVAEGDYATRVNQLLRQDAASKEIFDILFEKEAQILCLYEYNFYVLKTLCQIAEKEEQFNLPTLLQNVQSMEEAVCWYQKGVFLLRRFEFEWEQDDELFLLMKERRMSYICLAELICGEGIARKIHTSCMISQYLHENGLIREAVLFLMWLEQRLPYSERKIMMFAMTLLDMGERQLAFEILKKHQNPNKDINELKAALSEML